MVQTKQTSLAFARSPAVVVFEEEADNMTADWIDSIVATRTQRGVFSVYVRKRAEHWVNGCYRRKWETTRKIGGIKGAEPFVAALEECALDLDAVLDWAGIAEQLQKLDSRFADAISAIRRSC